MFKRQIIFKDDKDIVDFADRFLTARMSSLNNDIKRCLIKDKNIESEIGQPCTLSSFIILFWIIDLLAALYAGNTDSTPGEKTKRSKRYMKEFMNYKDHLINLQGIFRHKLVHLSEPAYGFLLQQRFTNLKSEVESFEATKQNLAKIIRDYNDQISTLGNTLYHDCLRCEQEERKLADLQTKKMKEDALIRRFEDNNEEYIKIRKNVEEKVHITLSNKRKLLDIVASFMIESIQENPKRYSFLIQHNLSSTPDFAGPDFNPFYAYGQQWPQQPIRSKAYFTEDYVNVLAEDTNNLMEKLAKKLEDEILSDYTVSDSRPSLLPSQDEDSHID